MNIKMSNGRDASKFAETGKKQGGKLEIGKNLC